MPDAIEVTVDGQLHTVPEGCTVAAAIFRTGSFAFRRSVTGQPRGPLCGMGICFECRVTIDGQPHQRSCQTLCRPHMQILTVPSASK
jgi:D-hydroxyproline dehydrogenase subunit gamma